MTLILNYTFSPYFAIVSSDKRVVEVNADALSDGGLYDPRKLGENDLSVVHEKQDKSFQLNEKLLIAAGGVSQVSTYLVEKLKDAIRPFHDLGMCKEILGIVVHEAQDDPELGSFSKYLEVKNSVSLFITGFYMDGHIGTLKFSSGQEIEETKCHPGSYYATSILPLEAYSDEDQTEMLTIEDFPQGVGKDAIKDLAFEKVIERVSFLHSLISYTQSVSVSPDYVIRVILHDLDGYHYEEFEIDSTAAHEQFRLIKEEEGT
ncbi:hypothetical protein [Jeotgalibacillus terrae]|uniref:Uncharacterized protein n=1 Tax=Jeotgalibacillus terrae TaxID=587735 RepID=A0ABW5ZN11_9BACL|nr:hypothetical protein [Jeotgalibacillus terrae]MBM7581095.1 hypothetical protein [Jeotgalibacillus terrae]